MRGRGARGEGTSLAIVSHMGAAMLPWSPSTSSSPPVDQPVAWPPPPASWPPSPSPSPSPRPRPRPRLALALALLAASLLAILHYRGDPLCVGQLEPRAEHLDPCSRQVAAVLGLHLRQPADGAVLLELGLRVGCSKHADLRADEVLVGHVHPDQLICAHLGPLALLTLLALLALLALLGGVVDVQAREELAEHARDRGCHSTCDRVACVV